MKTRIWVSILSAMLLAVVVDSLRHLSVESVDDWLIAAALVLLLVLVEHFDVKISIGSKLFSLSVGATIAIAAAFHFQPPDAALVVLLAHLIDSTIARRQPIKSITNIGIYTVSTWLASSIFWRLVAPGSSPLDSVPDILAAIAASVAFVLFSTAMLALIVGPVIGMPFFELWSQNLRATAIETIGLPAIGGMVAVLAQKNVAAVLLVGFPLMAPQLAYRALNEARRSIRTTLETLVDTLEERDRSTADHSRQVSVYASRILEEMPEVPAQLTETIQWASRVHDLGKVAVRDAILFKAGRLDEDEWVEMRSHAVVGADIIARLSQSDRIAMIIRHHHERWDGKGYPDGLSGESIPLGSRIISVADTYEAMTANRPYRRALPHEIAYEEILANSGTQFDPVVVAAFARAFKPDTDEEPSTWSPVSLNGPGTETRAVSVA
ncbi:MAG: HD domain-containing phosphohydrolase [Thermomicrobiales bacterium]